LDREAAKKIELGVRESRWVRFSTDDRMGRRRQQQDQAERKLIAFVFAFNGLQKLHCNL
jgi:hypothetical protein